MWWVGEKSYAGPGQRYRRRLAGSTVRSVRTDREGRHIGVADADARSRHLILVANFANRTTRRRGVRVQRDERTISPEARTAGDVVDESCGMELVKNRTIVLIINIQRTIRVFDSNQPDNCNQNEQTVGVRE